jgi:hypothetical protein
MILPKYVKKDVDYMKVRMYHNIDSAANLSKQQAWRMKARDTEGGASSTEREDATAEAGTRWETTRQGTGEAEGGERTEEEWGRGKAEVGRTRGGIYRARQRGRGGGDERTDD